MASPDHAATRFRKKPVEIEAIRWDGTEECLAVVLPWIDFDSLPDDGIHVVKGVGYVPALGTLDIPTLEGVMTASPGDWIIRGVKGEFYPCKPDIFGMTYERADAPSDRDALVAALAQAEHERDEWADTSERLSKAYGKRNREAERAERQRDQAIEALNAMTRECDYCDGRGWYGEPDHGPDCTPDKCGAPCPVERQVPCPSCAGSGRRL